MFIFNDLTKRLFSIFYTCDAHNVTCVILIVTYSKGKYYGMWSYVTSFLLKEVYIIYFCNVY